MSKKSPNQGRNGEIAGKTRFRPKAAELTPLFASSPHGRELGSGLGSSLGRARGGSATGRAAWVGHVDKQLLDVASRASLSPALE